MKTFITLLLFLTVAAAVNGAVFKDSLFLKKLPAQTIALNDITYKTTAQTQLKLDIYLPDSVGTNFPVLLCIHGGAWYGGTRTSELAGIPRLISAVLKHKIAVVSIDYRLSQQAVFPAQIQDCNDAVRFVYENSVRYKLNRGKIVVMGGSAGAHLAALVGATAGRDISGFRTGSLLPANSIKAVIDYFGPSDLIAMRGNSGAVDHDAENSAEARLIGASPLARPDLAKAASPTTYIDRNTPPFLIIHGSADPIVQNSQSILLNSYLSINHIYSQLIIVPDAGHGGPQFDTVELNAKVVAFLERFIGTSGQPSPE